MRALLTLLVLAATGFAAAQNACEPVPSTREILNRLAIPYDARQSSTERKMQALGALRKALASSPGDAFLHEAYQDAVIGSIGDDRGRAIDEYERLLEKHPGDPVFLYLAARANYGWNTAKAITHLERAAEPPTPFAPAHLLLARIYSAPAFKDDKKTALHLNRFSVLCPSSVRAFPELRWSKDRELIERTAARIRNALADRTDTDAASAYPLLWSLERSLAEADRESNHRERIRQDAEFLRGKGFPRSSPWLSALEAAADELGRSEWATDARRELADLYPRSIAARGLALSAGDRSSPAGLLSLAREWRGSLGAAYVVFRLLIANQVSSVPQVREASDLLAYAVTNDPDAALAYVPPVPLDAATTLASRGAYLECIPDLVRTGHVLADRAYRARSNSDLYPDAARSAERTREEWFMTGYSALLESQIRLSQLEAAKETLAHAENALNRLRPGAAAGSEQKFRHAEVEAWLWYLKGLYNLAQGRKLDALVMYRNSISAYPPRRPRPDRRDEVMQATQHLWKEMGGTAQAWNDWAARSPLTDFYAGSGGPNAWAQLARTKPELVLTDSYGAKWRPQDLAQKISFVTLWASWCGPCRAEMPYLDKLALRFKNRPEIVILALNVDDDPKDMHTALRELSVQTPCIEARDFAYEMLPTMAIPAAWLITPSKTVMFNSHGDLTKWLEDAVRAIESASAK